MRKHKILYINPDLRYPTSQSVISALLCLWRWKEIYSHSAKEINVQCDMNFLYLLYSRLDEPNGLIPVNGNSLVFALVNTIPRYKPSSKERHPVIAS